MPDSVMVLVTGHKEVLYEVATVVTYLVVSGPLTVTGTVVWITEVTVEVVVYVMTVV